MRLAHHTIWIDRPREAVFDFFTDFTQASRWRQYVESMAVVGGGPPRAGSRVTFTVSIMGERYTLELEVLACERPSRWRHHSFEPHFSGYVEYLFETEGTGTRVTFTINTKPKGLYGWLAIPLIYLRREKPYSEQLPNLKRVMEEG